MRATAFQRMLQNIGVAAVPGEVLTVIPGDTVRVHLEVEYRGPAVDGTCYVAFGRQNTWFNEDWHNQVAVRFAESYDFRKYEITVDLVTPNRPDVGYDLYGKIKDIPGPDIFTPTYLNVLDVLAAAEFRDFVVTAYQKV